PRIEADDFHLTLVSGIVIGGDLDAVGLERHATDAFQNRRRTMANRGGRDAEAATGNSSQTISGERKHQTFRGAPAFFGHRPAADFRVPNALSTGPLELGLDARPESVAPFRHARERAAAHAQILHLHRAVVLEVPGAAGHAV